MALLTETEVRARATRTTTLRKRAAHEIRGGPGNLHRRDEWSFCLTAARMAAEQERR